MDPLTATSLAGTIIQFIDLGAKIASSTHQIYKSAQGATVSNPDLKKIVKETLEKVVGGSKTGRWRSFRQALLSVWHEKQIDGLEKRLARLREQLAFRVLTSLRAEVGSMRVDHRAIPSLSAFIQNSTAWQAQLNQTLIDQFDTLHSRLEHESTTSTEAIYQTFLARLGFVAQNHREYGISDATAKTLQWIFEAPNLTLRPWANFSEWLRTGHGLYWVTDKAGSGNSTPMKFVRRHSQTMNLLQSWAGSSRLIVSSFYFWNSGPSMQMSQEGMLRTLLYSFACQAKEDVPAIAPQRWNITRTFMKDAGDWTLAELKLAFSRLASSNFQHLRLVFFIDGLDEFDGRHDDMIRLLGQMASYDHIEICVSSRPWPVFENAFQMKPSFKMQDLTANDIRTHVDVTFHQNFTFNQLKYFNPLLATRLTDQIAIRASGVFLWVTLVVRELLDGIQQGDRISDLQHRLNALLTDLYAFFHKMLIGTDGNASRNLDRAAKLLRIRLKGEISLLELALADEDDPGVLWCLPRRLDPLQQVWMAQSMRRRLSTVTKGLLEASNSAENKTWATRTQRNDNVPIIYSTAVYNGVPSDDASLRPKMKQLLDVLHACNSSSAELSTNTNLDWRVYLGGCAVQYLDRTVKDFMESPETIRMLESHQNDPELALCQSYILQLKFANPVGVVIESLVYRALCHGARVQHGNRNVALKLTRTNPGCVKAIRDMVIYSPELNANDVSSSYTAVAIKAAVLVSGVTTWISKVAQQYDVTTLEISGSSALESFMQWMGDDAFVRLVLGLRGGGLLLRQMQLHMRSTKRPSNRKRWHGAAFTRLVESNRKRRRLLQD